MYGAPTNAGLNGTGLIADNTLGDNELGWIKQVWEVQIQVMSGGSPQNSVLVEVVPSREITPIFSGYTDISGLTEHFDAVQYIVGNGGVVTVKNPHVILCDGSLSAWIDFEANGVYPVDI